MDEFSMLGGPRRSGVSMPDATPGAGPADAAAGAREQPRSRRSLAAAADAFLVSLGGKSPRTRSTYATGWRRFAEFLAGRAVDVESASPDALPAHSLEDFYTWLIRTYGRERRPTVMTYVSGVRALLRFLDRHALLGADVSLERMRAGLREVAGKGGYRTPRVDRRLPLILTYVDSLPIPESIPQRGARLKLLRDRAVLHTLFATGMRREEVARLDRSDIEDGWARQAIITGKGEKERIVFFTEAALAAIRAYLQVRDDGYAPLFLRHDRARGRPGRNGQGWRLSPLSVWLVVKKYARLAGVPATTHDFRHAKASVMLNRGAKLSEVQDILGHASPETTKRIYAHYESSHLREVFDRFSPTAQELAGQLEREAEARKATGG